MQKKICGSLVILVLSLFFASCERYVVGRIKVESNLPAKKYGDFTYADSNGKISIEGKINGEFFSGDVLSVAVMREIEATRFQNITKKSIKEKNKFAFSRLEGNKGGIIECFIKQRFDRIFVYGGIGRCYIKSNNEILDMKIESRAPFGF